MSMIEHLEWERDLSVGDLVQVRWGYGLGFRAVGLGRITKIFAKSFRVKLTENVDLDGSIGWPAGFELKGIPSAMNLNRNYNHGVFRRLNGVKS